MSGMYPDDKEVTIYGKKHRWPGLKDGKFTNGDFNDPLVPPSFIPADTVNLILDNLNNLITSLGGTPDNELLNQLVALFTVTAGAHKGIKRDATGRAKVAAPAAADDIARKAEVDAEATAREQGDSEQAEALSTHEKNRNHPPATPLLAGLMSSTDKERLDGCYIVASNFGDTSGYVKWSNGLIIQLIYFRSTTSQDKSFTFPLAYTNRPFITLTHESFYDSAPTSKSINYRNLSNTGVTAYVDNNLSELCIVAFGV